jgi:hypothetical protein
MNVVRLTLRSDNDKREGADLIDEVTPFLADEDHDPVIGKKKAEESWYRQVTLGAAGFFLAITLAMINAFYAMRGSVLVIQPPEQIILYRDGEGDKAVLTFALRVAMINAADAQNGDVLMNAHITPVSGGPKFRFTGTMKPVFTNDADAASKCDVGARCIAWPGFLAIEQTDEIIDIPGGTVRGTYLYYPAAEWNCVEAEGKGIGVCAAYANFETSLKTLSAKPLSVFVKIDFFQDGSRTLVCGGKTIDAAYIRKTGWMTMSCTTAKVEGRPWF